MAPRVPTSAAASALYAAVAMVLAYVFSLRRGEERPLPPIEVPSALRFDAEGRAEGSP